MQKIAGLVALLTILAIAVPGLAEDKPILAVMEVEDKTGKFKRKDLEAATEYLSTLLIASGKYSVVEKGRQEAKRKQVVDALKRESHDACYDDRCQIELGRALAADTLLGCSVIGIGKTCTLTCRMVPLEKEVADVAGVAKFDCSLDALAGGIELAAKQLGGIRILAKSTSSLVAHKSPLVREKGRSAITWVHSEPAKLEFAKTEITVAQYRGCVEAGACELQHHATKTNGKFCNSGYADRDDHPMNCVDWYGASSFCKWLGGRLPREDEWFAEASDRGDREYPWGSDDPDCSWCIMDDGTDGCGAKRTWPVCSRPTGNSVSGLCDVAGNLWEWTASWYDDSHKGRVLRGGSWRLKSTSYFSTAARGKVEPDNKSYFVGFRCVRSAR